MRKNSIKNTRINGEVQRELSRIISREIKDPRIAPMTSVVDAVVTSDLKQCKAYISVLGNDEEKARLFLPLKYDDIILNEYVSLFIQQFKSKLNDENRVFIAEIWYTKQIIGVFFKMIPIQDYKQDIVWVNKQNNTELLSFISKIGTEKITDKLFVQKDIRGFASNGNDFFIIKPNEKRLWYKAIGYMDVNEFSDAIIKIGRSF